jgi:hypothetical protein
MGTSLLKRGENAIAIFTHGKYFTKKRDGSGATGNWVIDQTRPCNKVVIYKRTAARNDVYVARRSAVKPSKDDGRFIIQLREIQYYGSTYLNWPQFAGSRNPVRYLYFSSQTTGKRRSTSRDGSDLNLELVLAGE